MSSDVTSSDVTSPGASAPLTALQRLSEFVVAVSAVTDADRMMTTAVERAVAAVDADGAAVVAPDGTLVASSDADTAAAVPVLYPLVDEHAGTRPLPAGTGAPAGAAARAPRVGAQGLGAPRVGAQGAAAGHLAWVDLDDTLGTLLVLRSGARPFGHDEQHLLRAFGRTLVLAARLLASLDDAVVLREERTAQERHAAGLVDELRQRHDLLDRLMEIQRAAGGRPPLQDTLDAITQDVADLLQADLVGLRLVDGADLSRLRLVSAGGRDRELVAVAKRSLTETGVAVEALSEQRLVVWHSDSDSDAGDGTDLADLGVRFAMAAPVFVGSAVVGCLSVASRDRGHGYGPDAQQVLRAFAEQAGLALGAAQAGGVEQGFRDPLTGLPNRTLFLHRLERALADDQPARPDVAVLLIDLDRFAYLNDGLGHLVGDQVLAVVAERVRRSLRDTDTAARLGGDELAVLLEDVTPVQAHEAGERLLAVLREPVAVDGRQLVVSASIGIAGSGPTPLDAGELLRNADVAMCRARHMGGDQIRVYEPALHAAVLLRLEIEADLRQALRNDELRLVYQPLVELSSLRIVGVEALLRWDHPRRGIVPPESFLQVADETGLIDDIGRWVLRSACVQAMRWQVLRAADDFFVSVNVSPRQLQRPGFVEEVDRALRDAALPPQQLLLEVNETALLRDPVTAADTLQSLKRLGMRIALDDFGSGYSSLNHLRQFPVDVMKIDRSFVAELGGEHQALVQTMVGLAHTLYLDTVAEGIETREQLEALRALGCVHGQGYYFSRPLPPGDVTGLLLRGTFGAQPGAAADATGTTEMAEGAAGPGGAAEGAGGAEVGAAEGAATVEAGPGRAEVAAGSVEGAATVEAGAGVTGSAGISEATAGADAH